MTPAVIPRGFLNQPWICHVDANYSTTAWPHRHQIPDRSDRRRVARDRAALAEALRNSWPRAWPMREIINGIFYDTGGLPVAAAAERLAAMGGRFTAGSPPGATTGALNG